MYPRPRFNFINLKTDLNRLTKLVDYPSFKRYGTYINCFQISKMTINQYSFVIDKGFIILVFKFNDNSIIKFEIGQLIDGKKQYYYHRLVSNKDLLQQLMECLYNKVKHEWY